MTTTCSTLLRKQLQQTLTWHVSGLAGFIDCNLLKTGLNLDQRMVGLDDFTTAYPRNLRPRYPHLWDVRPVYRDVRTSDVRQSLGESRLAQCLPGYQPGYTIAQDLPQAMPWYEQDAQKNLASRAAVGAL